MRNKATKANPALISSFRERLAIPFSEASISVPIIIKTDMALTIQLNNSILLIPIT